VTKSGIVVEVQKHKAIILTKDGSFETISIKKKQNLLVGQEIDTASFFTPATRTKTWFIPSLSAALAVAIVFLLFVSSIFPFQQNEAIAAYVSFDINPSIEVGVNKKLEVVKVRYLNEDGQNLFSDGDIVKHMTLADFSKELMQRFKESGYFNSYENMLIATAVEAKSAPQAIKESLTEVLLTVETDPIIIEDDVKITMLEATFEKRKAANRYGISFGKYALYEETLGQENLLAIGELQGLSYDELVAKISTLHQVVTAVNDEESSLSKNHVIEKDEPTFFIEEDIKITKDLAAEEVDAAGITSEQHSVNQEKEEINVSSNQYEKNSSVNKELDSIQEPIKEVEKPLDDKETDKKLQLKEDDDDNEQEIDDQDDEQENEDEHEHEYEDEDEDEGN
jgi:hypothetical protein